ncbi:MAG: (Fe-S)-binding protein [Deltaproteobacteria bacterium]|nr:(Fe-S)-binding protein [Deltaproteobacteria bacterium]
MSSLSPKVAREYCQVCPSLCHTSCPISELTGELRHTPWGKMNLARGLLEKQLPWTLENLEAIYQCYACGQCSDACAHSISLAEGLEEVRVQANELDLAPSGLKEIKKNFKQSNHPYRIEDLAPLPETWRLEKQERIFWPSCHTRRYFPHRLTIYQKLFAKLKIKGLGLWQGPLPCCGAPLKHLGLKEDFEELSEVLYHSLLSYRSIVVEDSACLQTFQTSYLKWGKGLKYKLVHLSEFLDSYLEHHPYRSREDKLQEAVLIKPIALKERPLEKLYEKITGQNLPVLLSKQGFLPTWGIEASYHRLFPKLAQKLSQKALKNLPPMESGTLLTADSLVQGQIESFSSPWKVRDFYEWMEEILY